MGDTVFSSYYRRDGWANPSLTVKSVLYPGTNLVSRGVFIQGIQLTAAVALCAFSGSSGLDLFLSVSGRYHSPWGGDWSPKDAL